MEIKEEPGFRKQETELVNTTSNQVADFETIVGNDHITNLRSGSNFSSSMPRDTKTPHGWHEASPSDGLARNESSSISMPTTPFGQTSHTPKKVFFDDQQQIISDKETSDGFDATSETNNPPQKKHYSQSKSTAYVESCNGVTNSPQTPLPQGRTPRGNRLRDTRFDSFKTFSGRLDRQLSKNFRGNNQVEPQPSRRPVNTSEGDALPVDRYFDALHGPELDRLRPSETLVLPEDRKWPFLLRFPVSSFGICLGVSSQAILWKTLATSMSTKFLHISLMVNLILWFISIGLVIIVAVIYALKLVFYFEAVRREYYHPIRINFFFAPFIALLFLAIGVPPTIAKTLPHALWYVLMVPFLCLELKIYGQWMSGGQRRLSKVANPTNHLSVVGNFVGALLGASMGLKEGPIFFFAIGMAHYTVLFVTLYQRLPTNETLPKDLHPVFFLFVAAPSVASMAWARIQGSFDHGAKLAYFIAMFLYFSLAVRINFFRGFRFSLAWWAYTFPMTGAAIATIRYSNAVTNGVTRALAIALCVVSMLTVTGLLVTTLLHAFVFRKLFPNDIAIAITDNRPSKPRRRWFHSRHGSSENNDIENYLKFVHPDDGKDLESSVEDPNSKVGQQGYQH